MRTTKVRLPKQWTTAQVRVNPQGKVQVKINPAKLGSGGRFAKCVASVKSKGGASDPKAVCAAAGRKKYGGKRMAAWAKAGRKRARRNGKDPVQVALQRMGIVAVRVGTGVWESMTDHHLYIWDREDGLIDLGRAPKPATRRSR